MTNPTQMPNIEDLPNPSIDELNLANSTAWQKFFPEFDTKSRALAIRNMIKFMSDQLKRVADHALKEAKKRRYENN